MEVIFLPELATGIKLAVYQQYKRLKDLKSKSNKAVEKALDTYLAKEYGYEVKIETFQKNIVTYKKPAKISLTDASTLNFIVLTSFLCGRGKIPSFEGKETLVGLLLELKAKNLTDPLVTHINDQLKAWNAYLYHFSHFYAFYYSLGGKKPDVALLKIDDDWKYAELVFYREDTSAFAGTIVTEGNGATVFVTLTDEKTKFMAFLSMIQDKGGKTAESVRFDGYYCSALTAANGSPVAGKMIAVKSPQKEAERIAKEADIKNEYATVLLNQRLEYKNHSLSAKDIAPYAGNYDGYWFKIKDSLQQVVKISFHIQKDGTVDFWEDGIEPQHGYIHQISKGVMKCSFDYVDDHNYRMLMVFNIQNKNLKYLDGVYCGQRFQASKIMAGKIRIYATTQKREEQTRAVYNFSDLNEQLGPLGKELLHFFWGDAVGSESNNYIQPNAATILKLFEKPLQQDKTEVKNAKGFAGNYLMYRLDSGKGRINCYQLNILSDGTFEYRMFHTNKVSIYKGTAKMIDSCLILSVEEKDHDVYTASYIFFVGKAGTIITLISGVYATIAFDKAPVCGRTILTTDHRTMDNIDKADPPKPFKIGSPEYREAKPDLAEILLFLRGTENNMIKSSHKKNILFRNIIYKDVFFGYACYFASEEKLKYLNLAFIHGFDNLEQLRVELDNGGALYSIRAKVLIYPPSDGWTKVELKNQYPSTDYYFPDKFD